MKPSVNEIVQIVDKDNRVIDAVPRHIMRQQRLIHRASYILVFNLNNELFIQKRTMSKDVYPGFWDVAAGGVVLADESYEESASRELQEELGISGVQLQYRFDHYYEDQDNRVWGRIFTCIHEGPFVLQEEEIVHGRFLAIDKCFQLSTTEPFTPDGLEILEKGIPAQRVTFS